MNDLLVNEAFKARVLLGVWGESFIKSFLEFSLPSLLAPGNLPALAAEYPLTFVFLTTPSDICVFEESPVFQKLKTICAIEFVSMKDLIVCGNYSTTLTYAFDRAIKQTGPEMLNTYFIFLTSDYIMADGSMQGLMRYIRKGYSGICAGNFQVTEEEVAPILKNYLDEAEHVLKISPRELVKLSMNYLHSITIASICDQTIIHNYRANRFFACDNQQVMGGRFYLLHMLCIKPETMDYRVGSSCDYSFIPEMCPSGNVAVINDSDDYLVVEVQPKAHELKYVNWGRYEPKKMVQALAEWTTIRHRENARHTIYYHSDDISQLERTNIETKLDQFIGTIDHGLSRYPIQPSYNHPYWKGATKAFVKERAIFSNLDDGEYANLLDLQQYNILRRTYYYFFGHPPRVFPWHYRWVEYQAVGTEINDYFSSQSGHQTLVLYEAYVQDFLRYHSWLQKIHTASCHYLLPEWLRLKNIIKAMQNRKFDACIIMVRVEGLAGIRSALSQVKEVLNKNGKVLLVIPNECRHLSKFSYDFLGEFSGRINTLVNMPYKIEKVTPIYSNISLLGAMAISEISTNYYHNRKMRFLMYILIGFPGILLTFFCNIFRRFFAGKMHCTNILVTLTPQN